MHGAAGMENNVQLAMCKISIDMQMIVGVKFLTLTTLIVTTILIFVSISHGAL